MSELRSLVLQALAARASLLADLADEGTDCYRLFHGSQEGCPGVTIDRYGPLLLAQTFREPLSAEDIALLQEVLGDAVTEAPLFVYNHRNKPKQAEFDDWHIAAPEALETMECHELGVAYLNRARHRGQDPMFFLDFRAVRRLLLAEAAGKSMLNLFAYTGTAGICAAVAGATDVWNVDFAGSALGWGQRQAALHDIPEGTITWLQEDIFPVLRQLAGLPLKGRASRRVTYKKLSPRQFDIVVLDPPTWAKSRWGAVDIVRDYQSMLKPALLTVADGGLLIATNHAAAVDRELWLAEISRCAEKAGRPFKSVDVLFPEDDFPSPDQNPLLKIALCRV